MEPDKVVGEIWQEVFLRRNLARGTHYGIGIFCLTEAGEQQIDWVPEKDWNWQGDAKNMADKSTKITVFIIREAL